MLVRSFSRSGLAAAGRQRTALAPAALCLAVLFWSGNFIAGRALGDSLDPLLLNALRWVICGALLLPFVAGRLIRYRREVLRDWRLLVLLGLTGIAAFHVMVYQALRLTPALNALLILAMAPVAAVVVGVVLDGFRPNRLQLLGLVLSLVGSFVVVSRGAPVDLAWNEVDRGQLWMFGAIVVWTLYSRLLRRRSADLPHDVTLAASILVALVVMGPVLLIDPRALPQPSPGLIGAVLYIAVFASLAGFLLWSYGVSHLGPERAGQFLHLMPIFGALMAVTLLGEAVASAQMLGAVLILSGLLLVVRRAPAGAQTCPRSMRSQPGSRR